MGNGEAGGRSPDGPADDHQSPNVRGKQPERDHPPGTTDKRGKPERSWAAPGQIPEPEERPWDGEPADPFDGIERSDPFAGRQKTAIPQVDEPVFDPDEPPAPGQPRRGSGPGEE
jgi:hypothetical protein